MDHGRCLAHTKTNAHGKKARLASRRGLRSGYCSRSRTPEEHSVAAATTKNNSRVSSSSNNNSSNNNSRNNNNNNRNNNNGGSSLSCSLSPSLLCSPSTSLALPLSPSHSLSRNEFWASSGLRPQDARVHGRGGRAIGSCGCASGGCNGGGGGGACFAMRTHGPQRHFTHASPPTEKASTRCKKLSTLFDLCVSSLRRGHANLLCIVPILSDDPLRESVMLARCGIRVCCKGVCGAV